MTKLSRHQWTPKVTRERWSERTCMHCGLVKVTRHEPDNFPPHWVEFVRDGERIDLGRTPACIPAARLETATASTGAA